MDDVKNAFQKVKQDIDSIKNELGFLKKSLDETREQMISICEITKEISEKIPQNTPNQASTQDYLIPASLTHPSTHNMPLELLKDQNIGISTGNQGASTDRQTHQQTQKTPKISENTPENSIDNAAKILDSLDSLKKDIRLKFKKLTEQELLIFSTLYQLDEEKGYSDYKTVADRINLTESSVRDYIGRLIKKGIPVDKTRINNKTIHLSISPNLKKVASLPTILQLRDL